MGARSRHGRYGILALLLAVVTSCVAPDLREVAKAPRRITDPRELVRRLAPGAELAALPPLVGAPVTSATGVQPFLDPAASEADADRAHACLTAAVYYEARSEPVDGQRAVAQVVLNRVRDRAFPHSVCGVVYQGVGSGRGCQFSFACDGSTLHAREPTGWAQAERVATAALDGSVMSDVGNATFYHADYVLPWWASSVARVATIGRHIFYRWPGALERTLGMGARYAGVEPGAPGGSVGVTVVRGTASFGVTVHRGESGVGEESEAPVAVARTAGASRVRVHRNEDAPVVAESASMAEGA